MRRTVLVATFAAMLLLASAQPAAAIQSGSYSYSLGHQADCDSGSSSGRADPISLIFYYNAWEDYTTNHIRFHTGWGGDDGADHQLFRSYGDCYESSDNGSASGGGHDDRYHIRIQIGAQYDATMGNWTAGTPHYEYWDWGCGSGLGSHFVAGNSPHPPGGFVKARNYIYDQMVGAPYHTGSSTYDYWGNTQHRPQCGSHPDAWSDGWIWSIHIGTYLH
jgi:hypothetical protein